jgi:hypothetical protein
VKRNHFIYVVALGIGLGVLSLFSSLNLRAQDAKASGDAAKPGTTTAGPDAKTGPSYSGMYAFLKEGEFVQLTVEDAGHVTGFISRFEGESDKGEFLDQFFKSGKIEGSKLSFTTEIVRGVGFDFKGTVERGEGRNPEDEAYFVLKGTLTETETAPDPSKKMTSHSQDVAFKIFPRDAAPAAGK